MYCGNCFRDNALVAALRRQGHETTLVPLYLPMTLDESTTAGSTPTFFGGINVYLSQVSSLYRRAPSFLRKWLDAPALLKWASGRAARTRAEDVGELTVSMLKGEQGNQSRELDELVTWLSTQPWPDAIFLSNAMLIGFARELKARLKTRVVCFLQSEESFLDAMGEPHRSEAWAVLAERARDVDGWVAPTRYFADRMAARLKLPPSRVDVVHNGILLDGYREVVRPSSKELAMGFFARMCPDKGLDTVVDAFIELRRRGVAPGLRLRVGGACGPGDESFVAEQKRKLQVAGLVSDASFHTNLSRDEKIAFLASCDVLSVPVRFSEAFGLYVIEALAAGTPLVQPDVCGFREILGATSGGVVYPVEGRESIALADALTPWLREPARLRAMGAAGRKTVFNAYSDEAMARGTVRVVESVAGTVR